MFTRKIKLNKDKTNIIVNDNPLRSSKCDIPWKLKKNTHLIIISEQIIEM